MNFREMSGLEVFQAMRDGKLPHPTMADTIPMRVTEASPGYVKFHARADGRHVNPLGGVHGGFAATVLDSVTGCAIHTLLEAGVRIGSRALSWTGAIRRRPIRLHQLGHRRVRLVLGPRTDHLERRGGVRASLRGRLPRLMRVVVNGVRLFFDVEGASLVPHGAAMRERPTLLLLHGGPGLDHSIYKPAFSTLAGIAQVLFLDHRGNGRSEPGPRESWTLAQSAEDVRAFCEAVGIERPIVYGASFGRTVALAYAARYPDHPAKLILVSTEAAGHTHLERRVGLFEPFGGPEVGALARRRFL